MRRAFVLLWLLPASGRAAPLTLDEVLARAERYPIYLAAREERGIAEGTLGAAQGAFDPFFRAQAVFEPVGYYVNQQLDTWIEAPTPLWGTRFFGGYRLGRGTFPDYEGKLVTNEGGEVRVGAALPLWRDGPIDRRRADIAQARLDQDVAALSIAEQRILLVREATVRYWAWVAAGQRLEVEQALLRLAVTRDAQVATRVERGDLAAIERTDNARAIVQREARVVAATRDLERNAIALSLFLRGSDGQPTLPDADRLPGALPEPEAPPDEPLVLDQHRALATRPEARRLGLLREQQQIELRWAKNQFAPAIDLFGAFSHDFGAGSPTRAQPELELGLRLDIPLAFRVARGRIRVAEARLSRAGLLAGFAADRIRAEVNDARSALRAALARLAVARREVGLAARLAEAERTRFDRGDSTLLFVNLREQAAAEASLREVDALSDYWSAHAAYRAALGAGGEP